MVNTNPKGSLLISSIIITTFVGIIYLLGYMKWPIVAAILTTVFITFMEYSIKSSNRNEKPRIIKEYESKVFFPDLENGLWINQISEKFWPYWKPSFSQFIAQNIMESYDFKNVKVTLGQAPPKVSSVLSYDIKELGNDEIFMDLNLAYTGDAVIDFCLLDGKQGTVKHIQIYGMIRVEMKPLINTIPFIESLCFYFLKEPDFYFNIDCNTELDLHNILRRAFKRKISSLMVKPNKLKIKLNQNNSTKWNFEFKTADEGSEA